jgi:hypothetical protein
LLSAATASKDSVAISAVAAAALYKAKARMVRARNLFLMVVIPALAIDHVGGHNGTM